MKPDCGHQMLQMEVEHIHIKSTWKQNSRFAAVKEINSHSSKFGGCPFNCCPNYGLTSCPPPPKQEYKPIGVAHNRKAQPFIAAANIDDKRQVVSASYNTPIGLYSSGNIQDAMEGQIRGLVHQKPQR